MRIDILTLFPEMFFSPLAHSILKRAQESGVVEIALWNIRDFTADRHGKVDDKPYGGGPGMVMACQPVFDCYERAVAAANEKPRSFILTPQGRRFDQKLAFELSGEKRLLLIAGRYEGFDERIHVGLGAEGLSIGDFVLTGGELPAMVVVDAVVRLLEGALGHEDSHKSESFSQGLLEYPQYTRPEKFRDMRVPDVLLSGDHGRIEQWREQQARKRTRQRRPDLLDNTENSEKSSGDKK